MANQKKTLFKGMLLGIVISAVIATMVIVVVLGSRVFFTQANRSFPGQASGDELSVDDKLEVLRRIIDKSFLYAEDIDDEALRDGILSGFVSGLGDPYSTFFNREAAQRFEEALQGEFSGIGVSMSPGQVSGSIEIVQVFDGTPAAEVGLQPGDLIFQVDYQEILHQDLDEIVSWIRGPEGTQVVLHFYRGEEVHEIEVTRRTVQIPTVASELDENNIGYIQVSGFDRVTTEQFLTALDELEAAGMEGLIIDLRSNPGGDVNVVVNMLRAMLPEGPIVSMVDRDGNRFTHSSDGDRVFDKPLVVLVNQFSASASEIFAGAIQDYEMGYVLGVQTFGKGVVQQLHPLPDGSMLRLTIAEYVTPLDRNINLVGITPDIEVPFELGEELGDDNQREAAVQFLLEQ